MILANASSNATNMTITATSEAYKQLADQAGITPESYLDQFVYYSDLQTADSPNLMWNPSTVLYYVNH